MPWLSASARLSLASLLSFALACSDDGSSSGDDVATETGMDATGNETDTGVEPDPNLLEIPGGTFDMGCVEALNGDCDTDNPSHSVTVSRFWLESTEVTVLAYEACVDAGTCSEPATGGECNWGLLPMGDHPVNCVTWQQAFDYCAWKGRRLPSEAEWELAARGTTGRPFPWGTEDPDCTRAHMFEMQEEMGGYGCLTNTTAAVGTYPSGASPFGALDMAGNVEEWVNDWFSETYYTEGPSSDPLGPSEGTQRVHRGGDYLDASPNNLRTFERWRADPDIAVPERGFRCAGDSNL